MSPIGVFSLSERACPLETVPPQARGKDRPVKIQCHLGAVLSFRLTTRQRTPAGHTPWRALASHRPLPPLCPQALPGVARIVGSGPKCLDGYALINRAKFQRPVRFDPTGGLGWEWTTGGCQSQDGTLHCHSLTGSRPRPCEQILVLPLAALSGSHSGWTPTVQADRSL